jgi:hypothetical protein
MLRESGQLLWISGSSLCDLGGSEEDDFAFGKFKNAWNDRYVFSLFWRYQLDIVFFNLAEDLTNPELIFPGCYSNVCFELSIEGLAVTTIIEATKLNELEGEIIFLLLLFIGTRLILLIVLTGSSTLSMDLMQFGEQFKANTR